MGSGFEGNVIRAELRKVTKTEIKHVNMILKCILKLASENVCLHTQAKTLVNRLMAQDFMK